MKWTDDRQFLLASLSAQGLSAAEIAERVGATKDQVASAMNRYGLFARAGRDRQAVTGRKRLKQRSRISLAPLRWMASP
jgi:hypothetical protein